MTALVSAVDLVIDYQTLKGGSIRAVEDFSLDVAAGELISIVGPSGCGKSTFLKALAGILPITSGQLLVDGEPVTKPGVDRSLVFQAAALLPWRTVAANVGYGLELRGLDRRARAARVHDLVNLVGLRGFEDKYPSELSGGMQQRVNLARALAVEPRILMLDEPFAALDAQTREFMQAEIMRIMKQTDSTMIFITHGIAEAIYLAHRVVVMTARPGRVRDVLDIDLPADRPLSIKRSPEFLDYESRVWTQIEEEVKNSGLMTA